MRHSGGRPSAIGLPALRERLALAGALVLACASASAAQAQAEWRYWTPADGLQESHSRKIGSLPGGGVTIRHGLVKRVDVLDGYVVEAIPEPRFGSETEAILAAVHSAPADETWAVSEGTLKQFRDGRWHVRTSPPVGETMQSALPIDSSRVLVLFPGRVAAFDPGRSTWTTVIDASASGLGRFSAMVRGFSGEIWVAATRGLGRLDGNRLQQWTGYPAAG